MFNRRPRTPPRGRRNARGRGIFRKPWTPNNKIKNKNSTGPANNTIPEIKEYYFDCSGIHEADRYITSKKGITAYIGTTYGGDIKATLENEEVFQFPEPEDPITANGYEDDVGEDGRVIRYAKDKMTYKEQKKFDNELTIFVKRKQTLATHMEKAYSIFLNQCTEALQDKLKNSKKWPNISATQNVLDLLDLIKVIVFKYEENQYMPLSIFNA